MNIFAAIDLETTGLDPAHCEVIDIAIVPLNADFTISTEIPEFACRIRAEHPERAEHGALETNHLNPAEGEAIKDVRAELVQWAMENGITTITPLAHNLTFDMSFIKRMVMSVFNFTLLITTPLETMMYSSMLSRPLANPRILVSFICVILVFARKQS